MTERHPLHYRILWTWDSWICNPFSAESYVEEYKKLIDFMAEWDYNGLVIWGFIDPRHGGEETAKEVASYGKLRGVRIMPGIGAGGYGGFVTQPEHPYNIQTLLRKRPDLAAVMRDAPHHKTDWWVCLYQEDTLKWLREGAAWLAESFEIGGVNIETNEAGGIDVCENAASASEAEPNRLKYAASFSDLSIAVPIIYEEVKKLHPDAWVTYDACEPVWWDRQEDAHLLAGMPEDAVAQWNVGLDASPIAQPPVRENISLITSGGCSYHAAAYPPTWTFAQYRCFHPMLEQCRASAVNHSANQVQGFALGKAGSHEMPDNEVNYIACVEFSREPEMTIDEFSERFIARLYGPEAAPLVTELMLEQEKLQPSLVRVWKDWANLMLKGASDKPALATPEQTEGLTNQLVLARRARELASDEGRARLDKVIGVLKEYSAIAGFSLSPRLAKFIKAIGKMDNGAIADGIRTLSWLAAEAGLPDRIYHYTRYL